MAEGIKFTRLLPSNASALEVALDQSGFDPVHILEYKTDSIPGAKLVEIPDSFLPWLVYEYGLEEVVPWVTDEREALRTGLKWQRVRGTPESLNIAMSWIGFTAEQIEEEVTGGAHWFEYQIEVDDVPSNTLVTNLIRLADLSAPIRSRLSRVYNAEWDIRPLLLDEDDWDHMLDDFSGIHGPYGTRLSFGRITYVYVERPENSGFAVGTGRIWGASATADAPVIEIGVQSLYTVAIEYTGQYWTGITWQVPETWASLHTHVAVAHTSEP